MGSQHQTRRVISVAVSSAVLLFCIGIYFKVMVGGGLEGLESNSASIGHLPEGLETALAVDAQGLSKAVVTVQTPRGKIRFKFYTQDAPKTVHRIADLIHSGFYQGLTFHRVEPGFVIQGGDPTGTGMGGSGKSLPAEFNSRKHVPGAVAMARAQDPNSADSQFYISLGTHPQLDGSYTVFGQVIEGQEVAAQIQVGDQMTSVTLDVP
jgi:cyclophilin family peptidyl-prolyl cis-trans isomerase